MNSNNPQPILSYDGHAGNVTSVGFQKDGKWMYTGSEDGTGEATRGVRHASAGGGDIKSQAPAHSLANLRPLLPLQPPHRARPKPRLPPLPTAVKIWDLRAPGCQREYESRAAVNTVVLHPNQGELISGERRCCWPSILHAAVLASRPCLPSR